MVQTRLALSLTVKEQVCRASDSRMKRPAHQLDERAFFRGGRVSHPSVIKPAFSKAKVAALRNWPVSSHRLASDDRVEFGLQLRQNVLVGELS